MQAVDGPSCMMASRVRVRGGGGGKAVNREAAACDGKRSGHPAGGGRRRCRRPARSVVLHPRAGPSSHRAAPATARPRGGRASQRPRSPGEAGFALPQREAPRAAVGALQGQPAARRGWGRGGRVSRAARGEPCWCNHAADSGNPRSCAPGRGMPGRQREADGRRAEVPATAPRVGPRGAAGLGSGVVRTSLQMLAPIQRRNTKGDRKHDLWPQLGWAVGGRRLRVANGCVAVETTWRRMEVHAFFPKLGQQQR